jgi:hypothetical protein
MAVTDLGSSGPGWPLATGGITKPKPVAVIVMASPGRMGLDALTAEPIFETEKTPGSCANRIT